MVAENEVSFFYSIRHFRCMYGAKYFQLKHSKLTLQQPNYLLIYAHLSLYTKHSVLF